MTRLLVSAMAALLLVACTDDHPTPVAPPEPEPPAGPRLVGVYDFEITGIGTELLSSTVKRVDLPTETGGLASLSPVGDGLVMEVVSRSGFTEGNRGLHLGQRYVGISYRVRNGTGVPLNNVTFVPARTNSTLAMSPFTSIRLFDDSHADPSLANTIVPTGAVMLGSALEMVSPFPDVLQVFTEAEIGSFSLPAPLIGIMPYGFVVRNANLTNSRALPATSDPNQFDGILTLAFRIPLQPNTPGTSDGEKQDVWSFGVRTLAIQDTETRMTESIEEGQDSAAVRRLRARALALGATTVTVLNGSSAVDPAVPNYPGQRQLCSVRTAGRPDSVVSTITLGGAFANFQVLRPGESPDPCAAYFRTGTPGRPATNVAFPVEIRAIDRYGNLKNLQRDTMVLAVEPGSPPATFSAPAPLSGGTANMTVTYHDYGNSTLLAVGRRVRSPQPLLVAGVTRTWTAGAGTTSWHTGGNWGGGAVPMGQDSVLIPAAAPLYPQLSGNVSIQGVEVENGATISLGAFDLTAGGNVATGTTGGVNSSVGRLILTGIARTVRGNVPRLRVIGTYSLDGNLTAVAPTRVESGRLRSGSFRIRTISQ